MSSQQPYPGWVAPIVVDPANPLPAYEQIRVQLVARIVMGWLSPGESIPSVRQLAEDLHVATNTVVRAYTELEQGGWVIATPRKGYFVAWQLPVLQPNERAYRLQFIVTELLETCQTIGVTVAELHAEIDR